MREPAAQAASGAVLVDDLDFATEVAQQAGELLLRYQRRDLRVDTKSSASDPVSEADRDAERLIADALSQQFPDDAVLGEEGASRPGTSERRWVIDPLDGTVNYLYGRDDWAVSIALERGGRPELGVVFAPASGRLYAGSTTAPATLNGRPVTVSSETVLAASLLNTGFSYEPHLRALQIAEISQLLPTIRDIRRTGSAALDLAGLAGGEADACYERYLRPWDVAAGVAIIRAAEGEAFVFETRPGFVGVVAGAPAIARELAELVGRPQDNHRTETRSNHA
jgi:myo-inositol-1(or 4)-monophosphatase